MSDIIYTPPVASGGTTINPTNTYIPVRTNATTFADSVLQSVPNTFVQSTRSGIGLGISTSFTSTTAETFIGDFNNLIDSKFIKVQNDAVTSRIYTSNSGFYLDYNVRQYRFGEYNNIFNGVYLNIDDINRQVSFTDNNVIDGLFLDYNNNTYSFGSLTTTNYLSIDSSNFLFNLFLNNTNVINFDLTIGTGFLCLQQNAQIYFDAATASVAMGDYNNTGTYGSTLICNDSTGQILTKFQGVAFVGMKLDFANNIFAFGDYNGLNTLTYFQADVNNKTITISGEDFRINTTTSVSAGGPSPLGHLVVKINGIDCKIQLLN